MLFIKIKRKKNLLHFLLFVCNSESSDATGFPRENENPLKSLLAPAEAGTAGESRGVRFVNSVSK